MLHAKKSHFLLSLCSSNALTYLDYWLVQQPWIILSPHGMLDTCVSVACSQTRAYLIGGGYCLAVSASKKRQILINFR